MISPPEEKRDCFILNWIWKENIAEMTEAGAKANIMGTASLGDFTINLRRFGF